MPETGLQLAELQEPPKSRRRILPHDVMELAKLVGKGVTESEACNLLDINYETWRSWKSRRANLPRFDNCLTRVRASKINGLLDRIESAGTKDWRAYNRILQIMDWDRFGDVKEVRVNVAAVPVDQVINAARKVFSRKSKVEVIDAQEIKALPAPKLP